MSDTTEDLVAQTLAAVDAAKAALQELLDLCNDLICPRCGSEDLHHMARTHETMGDYDQTRCLDCEHTWGDGYPDEASEPLPEGYIDCSRCNGEGGMYGSTCSKCRGSGIVTI